MKERKKHEKMVIMKGDTQGREEKAEEEKKENREEEGVGRMELTRRGE